MIPDCEQLGQSSTAIRIVYRVYWSGQRGPSVARLKYNSVTIRISRTQFRRGIGRCSVQSRTQFRRGIGMCCVQGRTQFRRGIGMCSIQSKTMLIKDKEWAINLRGCATSVSDPDPYSIRNRLPS
jgi:hypothetical protein